MASVMKRPIGSLTHADVDAEIRRRAAALVRDGLSPENAVTAAGSSFRAERSRHADAEIERVKQWLLNPGRRRTRQPNG